MAVQSDQLKIDPYTSTVPLVQMPVQDIEAGTRPAGPLPGQFGGHKGSGGLAIGDALLKGIMQGHQIKEQRKNAEAQTTIAAADAASQAAYSKYQDAITQAGGKQDDPQAKAAYQAYLKVFDQSKQAKAQFVIPPKPTKGASGQQKKGEKGEQKSGFSNIKEFFAANPHIVPQIALMTMQPNPEGLSPQGQQTLLETQKEQQAIAEGGAEMDEARRMRDARQTYSLYANLAPEEFDKLDPVQKDQFRVAKNMIFESEAGKVKYQILEDENHQQHEWPVGEPIPTGWKLHEKVPASLTPKVGTEQFMVSNYLQQHKIDPDKAPPQLLKYLHDVWQWRQAQRTANTSTSTMDPHGNRTTVTGSTRSSKEPQPGDYDLPKDFTAPSNDQEVPKEKPVGTGKPGSPLNSYPNPEDQPPAQSFSFNQQWAKPGPYLTTLSQADEAAFQKWAKENPRAVEGELDNPQADYDVRGHWLAAKNGDPSAKLTMNKWDGKLHGSDKWKTPYNGTFSNESIYANKDAPRWDGDRLVTKDGQIVADETPKSTKITKPPPAPKAATGRMAAPPQDGKETYQDRQNSRKVTDQQQAKYAAAEKSYDTALQKSKTQYSADFKRFVAAGNDEATARQKAQSLMDETNRVALEELNKSKGEIAKWYDQQVRLAGGKPGSETGSTVVPLPDGRKITFPNKAAADAFKRDAGIE
jgi:hypothetical protein